MAKYYINVPMKLKFDRIQNRNRKPKSKMFTMERKKRAILAFRRSGVSSS